MHTPLWSTRCALKEAEIFPQVSVALDNPLLLFSHHLPCCDSCYHQHACRIWALQSADSRTMCLHKGDFCTRIIYCACIAVSRKQYLMKVNINFLLGSVSARGSGRGKLLVPDRLDYVIPISQQKCSPFASEKRMSQGNLFAVLWPALPVYLGLAAHPVSSCEECKCALPSFPYLCQFFLTVWMVVF